MKFLCEYLWNCCDFKVQCGISASWLLCCRDWCERFIFCTKHLFINFNKISINPFPGYRGGKQRKDSHKFCFLVHFWSITAYNNERTLSTFTASISNNIDGHVWYSDYNICECHNKAAKAGEQGPSIPAEWQQITLWLFWMAFMCDWIRAILEKTASVSVKLRLNQ